MSNVLRSLSRSRCLVGMLRGTATRSASVARTYPIINQHRALSYQHEDKSLVSALEGEIAHEGQVPDLPTVTGFSASYSGCQVVLERSVDNESIQVELNINDMVELAPLQEEEENPPQYVPNFKIKIIKPQGSLVFYCNYHMEPASEEQEYNQYVVSEVSYVPRGAPTETAYTTDYGNLDLGLIGEFESYLDRRGLGSKFSTEFFEFSSALENSSYVNFLKNVRDFV